RNTHRATLPTTTKLPLSISCWPSSTITLVQIGLTILSFGSGWLNEIRVRRMLGRSARSNQPSAASLRLHHGWTEARIAEVMSVSERTIQQGWRSAGAKLQDPVRGGVI